MNDGGNFISPDEFAFLEDGCLCMGKFTVANVFRSGVKWLGIHLVETVLKAFVTDPQERGSRVPKSPTGEKAAPRPNGETFIFFPEVFIFLVLCAARGLYIYTAWYMV